MIIIYEMIIYLNCRLKKYTNTITVTIFQLKQLIEGFFFQLLKLKYRHCDGLQVSLQELMPVKMTQYSTTARTLTFVMSVRRMKSVLLPKIFHGRPVLLSVIVPLSSV